MGKSALLSNGKGSNADKVQDSETSLLVSKKADKNYLDDSERTQKSRLGLVFELLATTACTSYSNSLSESVRFLKSQLQITILTAEIKSLTDHMILNKKDNISKRGLQKKSF